MRSTSLILLPFLLNLNIYMFDGFVVRIPVIRGKGLNLHVFYIEITERGGYDKVGETYGFCP